jgi:hypothetical protein
MPIALKSTGGGSVTLDVPSTASDFTLNLPASNGTVLTTAGGTVTGDLTVPSINNGPLAGFRNAIINGNFDFWQRGTSVTGIANDQYLADRWAHLRVGTTANVSRQAFTVGQTDVPGEPVYFHRTVVSSVAAAGNALNFNQKIESVRTFAGQTVTCSFWAKADASKNIAFNLTQVFGSGGSPSAAVVSGVTTIALTTAWQKFAVTVSVPSISEKTVGSANDDALWVRFWLDAGSNFNSQTNSLGQQSGTFDIAQVQLEAGSVATPFERRPIGTELALCQRYAYAWGPGAQNVSTYSSGLYSDPDQILMLPLGINASGMRSLSGTITAVGTQGTDWAVQTSAGVNQTGFTLAWVNGIIFVGKAGHGITNGNCNIQVLTSNGRIIVATEL